MNNLKILHFPGFTLKTPSTWTISFDESYIDSIFVNMDATDRFRIDIGMNIRDISAYQSIVVEEISIEQVVSEENEGQIIEEKTSRKIQKFYSNIHPNTIANREVKYLIPKTQGKGVTGVFFAEPDLLTEPGPPISFTAFNLKSENQTQFFEAVRTLTFDKSKNANE